MVMVPIKNMKNVMMRMQHLVMGKILVFMSSRCSNLCKVETGWYCYGDRLSTTACYELCGDGRNFKTLATACDDGNNVNGDG